MKVHFIAIGDGVMHQLALALHKKGYVVSGSDDELNEPALSNLQKEGLLPAKVGWYPEKITPDMDAVILAVHAQNDNPELQHAKDLGLKVYSFSEYMYEESRFKTRVVISGSRGKTTTTSMIMQVLQKAGKDFDYLVGTRPEGFDGQLRLTHAPMVVCESDEYPASIPDKRPKFHFLCPHIAIITGIARDPLQVFPTFDLYLEQFAIFIQKIEPGGLLIYNETDEILKKLVTSNKRTDIRYQPYQIPPHVISQEKTSFTIEGQTGELPVSGNHNLLNLHAAWYACSGLGINATDFVQAVTSRTGIEMHA
jgi:UDP-N-acetylmuramate: L-alanyl-gamma-D-glutamyl-meso-diaminopimelate ligase